LDSTVLGCITIAVFWKYGKAGAMKARNLFSGWVT